MDLFKENIAPMPLFKMAGKLFNLPFFKMAADAILKFIKINIFVTVMTITTNEVSICTIFLMLNLLDAVLNYFEVVLTSKSKMAADAILKFIKINIFVTVMTITTNEVSICTISLMLNLLDEVLNYFEVVLTSKSKMAADAILKFIKIYIFVTVMTITTNEVSTCNISLMLNLLDEVLNYFEVVLTSKSKMVADTILKFIKIDIFVITMTITTK